MAGRIPILTDLTPPPGGIDDDLHQQALATKNEVAQQLAAQAVYGRLPGPDEQTAFLQQRLATARDQLVDAAGAAPIRTEILDATGRHRQMLREAEATNAAAAAHTAALAAGTDPEKASADAYQAALGTPTRGGAYIPHFNHTGQPASIDPNTYTALQHSGIRTYGTESAGDYTAITRNGGDLHAWGFHNSAGAMRSPHIKTMTDTHARFVNATLTPDERDALRTYTSGTHMGSGAFQDINDAYTGRTTTPRSPAIQATRSHLDSAFAKWKQHNTTTEPAILLRGTKKPPNWTGDARSYLATAFPVGAKLELTQITSTSTHLATATRFASRGPDSYLMVIRTRDGMPVKAISANAAENEVIVPPGTALRCVRIDEAGIQNNPTVYLLAEDLAAEIDQAQAGVTQQAS